jgi:hypothetical protein
VATVLAFWGVNEVNKSRFSPKSVVNQVCFYKLVENIRFTTNLAENTIGFSYKLVENIRFTTNLVENIRFTTDLAENRVLFTSFTPQKASTFVSFGLVKTSVGRGA